MSSSPEEVPSVDPTPARQSGTSTDPVQPQGRRLPPATGNGDLPRGRYSPAMLTLNVVHLLRGQGVPVSGALEHLHQASESSAELLQWLGVEPDKGLITKPREDTVELVAAAVLLRAAGIEPNAVTSWPRRSA